MFCKNCGSQISDNAVVCPRCGVRVGELSGENNSTEGNSIAIVGFVFSFLFALVGLICSGVGYKNAKNGAPYKGLALAGIIISALSMALAVILYIVFFSVALTR